MGISSHKHIMWLASYPKSGNTWFRAFLANLLHPGALPADINELEGGPIASSRLLFDEATGISSSDLSMDETENLRPSVYRYLAQQSHQTIYHKIHDAYIYTQAGEPLIPSECTQGALYFVRNPLDVAVSFAHHANTRFDSIAAFMGNNDYAFCAKSSRLHMQLRQKLLTWSNHIQSWIDQKEFPVLCLRYEDMVMNPEETFTRAVKFCKLDYQACDIQEAIRKSSFEVLKKQEEEKGFKEKSPDSKIFFRKGKMGSWKEELDAVVIKQIMMDHQHMMIRLGYNLDMDE